jgi:uncharacterized membrane protein YphA (DoxX/SURF4 family)
VTPETDEIELLRPAAVGLAAVRIWCGIWFLIAACPKLPLSGLAHWKLPGAVTGWVQQLAEKGAHEAYRPVLEHVAAHPTAVAVLLAAAELSVGVLLVLGLFARPAALAAAVLSLNYWLATLRLGMAHVGLHLTLGVVSLCLVLGNAGRFYGLDSWREARRRGV